MVTNKDNFCVIMGGGIGSRFWPFSRKTKTVSGFLRYRTFLAAANLRPLQAGNPHGKYTYRNK